MGNDLGQRLMRLLPSRAAACSGSAAPADEKAWVERLRRAEPAAIDQLYRAQHQALRAYAQRLIGDPSAAEDLVHDVFVRLPELLANFRADSSLRTFLFGVATRLSQRHLGTALRRRGLLARHGSALDPSDAATPECALAQVQQLSRLQAALDVLPLAQRAAFVLCELEERSMREAAEILGIPESTVRTRCFHARKRLQAQLSRRSP
jgi:RNA polymerase sigma-70 factor (ECF subfamily)